MDSVRVQVRFIELEQQAAIRHNSIILFFRAFLPSSRPCYDSSRRSGIQAPHVYIKSAERGFALAPSRSEEPLFELYLSSWQNREFQIPDPKHLPSEACCTREEYLLLRTLRKSLSNTPLFIFVYTNHVT